MAKVLIEETTLTAIGDAIRGKEGTTDLVPVNDMATRISAIQGGGAELPEEALVITGGCNYKFSYNGWNWFLDNYKDKITTNKITSFSYGFRYTSALKEIPIEVFNLTPTETSCSCAYLFDGCTSLERVPYLTGKPESLNNIFSSCYRLRAIPEDWADHIDWTRIQTYNYAGLSNMFYYCYSLRQIPQSLIDNLWSIGTSGTYVPYPSMYRYCASLNELNDLAVHQGELTANRMTYTVSDCHRLAKFTFATQSDGSPYTVKWKTQTLDLSQNTGWGSSQTYILSYNSGITADKEVKDDATYQALKNDPDWFTINVAYSRYNHDSAVETINSLPDTSAYGTNTIKFKGAAGSATDGGAINTLTAEEIAVASAKGWTVTLV